MAGLRTRRWWAIGAVAVGLLSVAGPATASVPVSQGASTPVVEHSCAEDPGPGRASCFALKRTDVKAVRGVLPDATNPSGFGPADLTAAYALPSASAGDGATVAIVDAYDDPTAESDLAAYRAQYGLPACTTDNGCFRKVDQRGGTDYPTPDSGWSGEISLDLDMVSAVCPNCHILLVEGDDNSMDALAAAVDQAVALGAKYVSNSYGTDGEDPTEVDYDSHYHHPGVVVTASTGDNGYGVSYPAAAQGVVAVGGTSLSRAAGTARGWAERAWNGAGSGCSAYEDKPSWQTDGGCGKRAVADVSAVADPATGVAVYYNENWVVYGGTSASAPIIAATYALAGTPAAGSEAASYPYDAVTVDGAALNDVTSGSNGTCSPAYLCTGGAGFDGPTGLGTPHGVAAFTYKAPGAVAGTVTDSATHQPVPDVAVTALGRRVSTGADGAYRLGLPAGTWQLTLSRRGYETRTLSVTVAEGGTTSEDVALAPVPTVAVTGAVTDGSGHGWGLYAKVTASDGTTAYTDPATGAYRLDLLQNETYTLSVSAVDDGYEPGEATVDVATTAVGRDFALHVDVRCVAAGYRPELDGITQPFDRTGAPKGWQVSNVDHHQPGYAAQPGWQFTNPGKRGNDTGGDGNLAIVDSDHTGPAHIQDTTLTSPATDLTRAASPAIQFGTDLRGAVNSTATVEVSTDGGRTWTAVWHEAGTTSVTGPVVVPLPQAAGHTARIRFHYTGSWSRWWAVDDVFLGNRTCTAVAGGLLVGRVTDATTGAGLTGATVTAAGRTATTVATPGDTAVGGGLYHLFTPAGTQQVTASAPDHTATTATATVTPDQPTHLDFPLS